MPQYKVTFLFNQSRMGWSETWYFFGSNLKAVQDATNNLAGIRMSCLGNGSVLEAARISDLDKPRQCSLYPITPLSAIESATDAAWTAVNMEICAGDQEYRRSFLIRGLADTWINYDPTLDRMAINNVGRPKLVNYIAALKLGWQLRVISKDAADVNKVDAGALGTAASGNVTVQVLGTSAKAGETIRLSEFVGPDAKLLNRVWKVVKVTAVTVELNLQADLLTDITADGGGKVWHHKIVYRPITSGQVLFPAKKSTGRAFFAPRGRRSNLGMRLF